MFVIVIRLLAPFFVLPAEYPRNANVSPASPGGPHRLWLQARLIDSPSCRLLDHSEDLGHNKLSRSVDVVALRPGRNQRADVFTEGWTFHLLP